MTAIATVSPAGRHSTPAATLTSACFGIDRHRMVILGRVRRFGLYTGGFLGPFGGGIIAVLIPQLRDEFDAGTSEVTSGASPPT